MDAYIKRVQSKSKLRFFAGVVIRFLINIKYGLARVEARRRGAQIGKSVVMTWKLAHYSNSNLHIGDDTSIQTADIDLRNPVFIGSHVIIGTETEIITTSHNIDSPFFEGKNYGITIEDYAWLPVKVLVLPSCRKIGRGAVVSSGSVVVKDVESMSVVSGNPAREIRKRKNVHDELVVSSLMGGDFCQYIKVRKL